MDKVPTVNNCCWFFDVETGSKIIGFLGAIAYAIWFVSDLVEIITFKKNDGGVPWGTILFGLIIDVFMFFISVILLIGVYKNRQRFVKTWLIVIAIILILMVVQLIITIFSFSISRIVSDIIAICLLCYAVVVVMSFSRGMPSNTGATTY